MGKKLLKKSKNKVIFGVCGGFAEYLDTDPTVIRIIWILASLAAGSGVLVYLICALIIPKS